MIPLQRGYRPPEPDSTSLLLEWTGLLAGLVLVLLEAVMLHGAHASIALQLVSAVVILFSVGLVVAALRLGWLVMLLVGKDRPWLRALAMAALTLPVIVPVSVLLFSGTGISTKGYAAYGPFLLIPLLFGLTVVGMRFGALLARQLIDWSWRPLLALPMALFCIALIWLDRHVYPNQYSYLHWLLLLLTVIGLIIVVWLLLGKIRPRWWLVFGPVALAAMAPAFVTSTLVSLNSERRKQALLEHSHTAGRLVDYYRNLFDRDGDGHSILFGDTDCDNSDPRIHPLARDIPQNGVDEDCSGQDALIVHVSQASSPREAILDAAGYRESLKRWRDEPAFRRHLDQTAGYNILLLVIDSLRGRLLSSSDPSAEENRANHPALMRLAREACTFEYAFSTGAGTDLGMSSLLTGELTPSSRQHISLLKAFESAGLVTHGVFQREVERWLGRRIQIDGLTSRRIIINDPRRRDVGNQATARQVSDHGITFLRNNRDQRFLLWLHYFDLHEHHQIDPSTMERPSAYNGIARGLPFYRAMLRYTDTHVSRVLSALKELDLARRTIVVLLSDHGEGLAEASRLPQNHGDVLFNPLVHVAASILVPGQQARRVATPISIADIYPTLLDLAGIARAAGQPSYGLSLLPYLFGQHKAELARLQRPILLYEAKQRGVILWPWKLLVWWDRGLTELYNIERDYDEQNNLADDLPQQARRLAEVLNRYSLPRVNRLADASRIKQ